VLVVRGVIAICEGSVVTLCQDAAEDDQEEEQVGERALKTGLSFSLASI